MGRGIEPRSPARPCCLVLIHPSRDTTGGDINGETMERRNSDKIFKTMNRNIVLYITRMTKE